MAFLLVNIKFTILQKLPERFSECIGQCKSSDKIYNAEWVAMRDKYMPNTFFLKHTVFNVMLLERFVPLKGDLLEIGSGTGEFIHMAQAAGWRVRGIEPSSPACSHAREKYRVNLENSIESPLYHEKDHLFHYSLQGLKKILEQTPLETLALFSREEPNRLFNGLAS